MTPLPSITHAIDKQVLASELSADKLIRTYKGLEIYLVTAEDAPRVMTEIGRIREVEFRREGGGTGKPKDIDRFDQGPVPYRQLVAWDPLNQEIVAMYRYILCRDAMHLDGGVDLATAKLFDFSSHFQTQYLPKTIELGRSVVNRMAKRRRFGLFAVWCGLGALVQEYPDMAYFFGKVTIPPADAQVAKDLLLPFIHRYWPDFERLVWPKSNYQVQIEEDAPASVRVVGDRTALKALKGELRQRGQNVPSLLNSYLKTSDQLRYFGSAYNLGVGNVMESAILIPIDSIKAKPKRLFIDSYNYPNSQRFRALDRQSGVGSLASDISRLEAAIHLAMAEDNPPRKHTTERTSDNSQKPLSAEPSALLSC